MQKSVVKKINGAMRGPNLQKPLKMKNYWKSWNPDSWNPDS